MAEELLKTGRNDSFKVDPRRLRIPEGHNTRVEFELDELVDSIAVLGVQQPLEGYRESDGNGDHIYYVTNGERRYRAIQSLLEKGIQIQRVPFILEPKGTTPADRIKRMITANEGKRFTQYEYGLAYNQMIALGYQVKEIAKEVGKDPSWVSQCISLTKLDKRIQNEIVAGTISTTAVLAVAQVEKDPEKQLTIIKESVDKSNGVKVTKTDIKEVSDKKDRKTIAKGLELLFDRADAVSLEENTRLADILALILAEVKSDKTIDEAVAELNIQLVK